VAVHSGRRMECVGYLYYLNRCGVKHCMEDNRLREFTDQLESLHRRQDKFYEWAGLLQKEFRAMQQRIAFLESQCELDLGQDAENTCLLNRLANVRKGK